MIPVLVFDDARMALAPLTSLRASFDVRTGAWTLVERLVRGLGLNVIGAAVDEEIAPLTRQRHGFPVNAMPDVHAGPVLALNGRTVLPDARAFELAVGDSIVERESGALVAAMLPGIDAATITSGVVNAPNGTRHDASPGALLTRPWDVIRSRNAAIAFDLNAIAGASAANTPEHVIGVGESPLIVHPGATVYPAVTFDLEHGPVVVDEHATVRPLSVVCGPAYIGPHATVLDRAVVRGNTAVGPWSKVNGELSGVIVQGYSNKAHDGFLGDSWVGEWVNLGAGTTNSNLLNTYGEVIARAAPNGPNERTGMQFLGTLIGDHVKTAICTRIMTGAVIHTGAMIACTSAASGCVRAFSWCTDDGARPYRTDKFMDVAKAAMARRSVPLEGEYAALLRRLADAAERA